MLGNSALNTYYICLNNTVKTVENLKMNKKLKKWKAEVEYCILQCWALKYICLLYILSYNTHNIVFIKSVLKFTELFQS